MGRAGVFLVMTCLSTGAASAQERACPEPGTQVEYSSGIKFEYTGWTGITCTRVSSGRKLTNQVGGILFPNENTPASLIETLSKIWSLSVGNSARIPITSTSTAGDVTTYESIFSVEGRETVTTAAGTFDTYLVTRRYKGMVNNYYHHEDRYWLSSNNGVIVKYVFRLWQGQNQNPPGNFELTKITYPGQSRTPAPVAEPAPSVAVPPPSPPVRSAAPAASPPTMPAPPAAAGTRADPADRLQALKRLLDQKLITPAEYEVKRKQIIDDL